MRCASRILAALFTLWVHHGAAIALEPEQQHALDGFLSENDACHVLEPIDVPLTWASRLNWNLGAGGMVTVTRGQATRFGGALVPALWFVVASSDGHCVTPPRPETIRHLDLIIPDRIRRRAFSLGLESTSAVTDRFRTDVIPFARLSSGWDARRRRGVVPYEELGLSLGPTFGARGLGASAQLDAVYLMLAGGVRYAFVPSTRSHQVVFWIGLHDLEDWWLLSH